MGIYTPNVTASNASEVTDFFRMLNDFFIDHPDWKSDYMGGDMNFVKDAIDCLPMCTDHADIRAAFDDLKRLLGL